MAEERPKAVITPPEDIPIIRDSNYCRSYVNQVRVSATSWDIQLTLGAMTENEPNRPAVLDQVTLIMNVEFAKALVNTLIGAVNEFEQQRRAAIQQRAATPPGMKPST